MKPTNNERRHQPKPEAHTLAVHLIAGRLIPMCACGEIIGGNRDTDTTRITLHDLLRLTVTHTRQLDRGQ